jgi:hypothetical protein
MALKLLCTASWTTSPPPASISASFEVMRVLVLWVHLALLPLSPDGTNCQRCLLTAQRAHVAWTSSTWLAAPASLGRSRLLRSFLDLLVVMLCVGWRHLQHRANAFDGQQRLGRRPGSGAQRKRK